MTEQSSQKVTEQVHWRHRVQTLTQFKWKLAKFGSHWTVKLELNYWLYKSKSDCVEENSLLGKKRNSLQSKDCRRPMRGNWLRGKQLYLPSALSRETTPSGRFPPLSCEHKKSNACLCGWSICIILSDLKEKILWKRHNTFVQLSQNGEGCRGAENVFCKYVLLLVGRRGTFNNNDCIIKNTVIRMRQCKMDIPTAIRRKHKSTWFASRWKNSICYANMIFNRLVSWMVQKIRI